MLSKTQKLRILLAILVALCVALQFQTLIVQTERTKDVQDNLRARKRGMVNKTIYHKRERPDAGRTILHVFQYGAPRTATTTQFNIVCVSLFLHVQMHHPELLENTICNMAGRKSGTSDAVKFFNNVPQVTKSHVKNPDPRHFKNSTVIFTTDFTKAEAARKKDVLRSQGFNVAMIQDVETLAEIGISGMVKQYATFFDLTPKDVDSMLTYFGAWDRLRQCCGMQMSSSFRNELLPASQKAKSMKKHDFCGSVDLDSLEVQFMNSELYKLLNNYELMKRINRPSMVDGDLDGSYCSRYNDAVRERGNTSNKTVPGLNSRYPGVKHNWEEGRKNPFLSLREKIINQQQKNETNEHRNQNSIESLSEDLSFSPWVEDYISFHQSSIIHGKLADNVPYLIYECKDGEARCGGAGDRLIGMIKIFYLAMCSRRVFLIDAPFPIPLTDVFNPSYIEWNATFPETSDYFPDMDYLSNFSLREEIKGYRIPRTNGIPRKKGLDEIWESSLMEAHLRKGQWSEMARNVTLASVAREAFRAMFQFNQAVTSRAEELRAVSGISGPYLGMHIRKGDAKMKVGGSRRQLTHDQRWTDDNEVMRCYRQMNSSHPNAFAMAYLASDDVSTKVKLAKEDPSLHFAQLRPFHIDKASRRVKNYSKNHSVDRATVYNGVIDTWAEMLIMAESTCLILSKSMFTFSSLHMRDSHKCAVALDHCNDPNHRKGNKDYFSEMIAERGFVFLWNDV